MSPQLIRSALASTLAMAALALSGQQGSAPAEANGASAIPVFAGLPAPLRPAR